MGILCPCGVTVNACTKKNNVEFIGMCKTRRGKITYLANVCVTTPGKSTLSLTFVDSKNPGSNNFLFTANTITSTDCKKDGLNCVVTVKGTGLVNGRQYPFKAVFRDQVAQAANDCVQSFVIKGFFDQNGAVSVPQGSIVALGCREL